MRYDWRAFTVWFAAGTLACGGDDAGEGGASSAPTTTGTSTPTTDTSSSSSASETSTSMGSTADSTDSGPLFDIGAQVDVGGGYEGPIIPETCAQAEMAETTVGCLFYGVDLDQNGPLENDQYAIAVSNVQQAAVATVTLETKMGGNWVEVEPPVMVPALDLYAFELPNLNQQGSGVLAGGAYRVTSDVPIIAYQFNPFMAGAYSSDASMLYPVTSWDTLNQLVHWGEGYGRGYLTIAAASNGTQIEVTTTQPTDAGPGVPAGAPGVPFMITLDEGDIAEVMVSADNLQLTGTKVSSDVPVAVFSGHECAWIPLGMVACDHVEDQISGLRLWGRSFVASRVPVRQQGTPETSLWQIYASEDDTEVTLTASANITGLPVTPVTLDQGDKLEFFASGTIDDPGDFLVDASRPIAVVNYMTGWGNLNNNSSGDPAMVQLSPIEQFIPRYVIMVPTQWDNDYVVLTRLAGAEITIDGVPVPDTEFIPVGADHEVARHAIADGVHLLDSEEAFSVVVVGFDFADSYAYLGGSSTGKINPNPPG